MGLFGDIVKGLSEAMIDTYEDKWKVFPCCSSTAGTTDIVKLLNKWNEIFERENFFQGMKMTPIDRYIDSNLYDVCEVDPNNSKEYKEMPGPENVFHPRDGWVCELGTGGTIFISVKDWVRYHPLSTRGYRGYDEDDDGRHESNIYDLEIGSYCNLGRYNPEFAELIFRTYYLHYKPEKNSARYMTFLISVGDCCKHADTYLCPKYQEFISTLNMEGWYDPPASMYLGYGDGTSSIYGYLTALRYDSQYLPSSKTHREKPYGEVKNCLDFFALLSNEEWAEGLSLILLDNLEEFVKPVCQEIERLNDVEVQNFRNVAKRQQEEEKAAQLRKADELCKQEEERQKKESELRNSLDSF